MDISINLDADSNRLFVVIALFLWLAQQSGTASEAVYVTHIFSIDNFSPVYHPYSSSVARWYCFQ